MVKGLTWDPVGKYIASQADDRSLKVWRTLDWQLETSITKPFDEVMRQPRELSPAPFLASVHRGAGWGGCFVGESESGGLSRLVKVLGEGGHFGPKSQMMKIFHFSDVIRCPPLEEKNLKVLKLRRYPTTLCHTAGCHRHGWNYFSPCDIYIALTMGCMGGQGDGGGSLLYFF